MTAVFRPKTLPDFLKFIERLQGQAQHSLWYRGSGRASRTLTPSLYRHPKYKLPTDFEELERKLMTRFRQRSIPYHNRNLEDHWQALFFMQHYGVPTRLLDWTENPLVALHFALMSAPKHKSPKGHTSYSEPAVVWILDPTSWNRSALAHMSYTGEALAPGDDILKGYTPHTSHGAMSKWPVALYGAHNSPRIVAQQGVFVLFGQDRTPMEKLRGKHAFKANSLVKVLLQLRHIVHMRHSLLNHGITESVVFPDLEGLAKETKRHFGFED